MFAVLAGLLALATGDQPVGVERSPGDGIAPLLFPSCVERVLAMAKHRWRRTDLIAASGGPVEDDYCLLDAAGQSIARIYKVRGGPYGGHWFYALQVDERGRPWNAGTGYCATGPEAKQICEAMAAKVVLPG